MKAYATLLVFSASLFFAVRAEAAKLTIGQSCQLSADVQIDPRRRDSDAKVTLEAGALVRVLAIWQNEYRVVSGEKRGWVAESVLDPLCETAPKVPRLQSR